MIRQKYNGLSYRERIQKPKNRKVHAFGTFQDDEFDVATATTLKEVKELAAHDLTISPR
jgi:hypothetical protein